MKSFLLAAKIAAVFTAVLLTALVLTLLLFLRVAGRDTMREVALLMAHQGVAIAEEVEGLIASGQSVEGEAVAELVGRQVGKSGLHLGLIPAGAAPRELAWFWPHARSSREVEVAGRNCWIDGPPVLEVRIPILHQGVEVRQLRIEDPLHSRQIHSAFMMGLRQIGLVSVVSVIALAMYLTAPLRRMRRSMDRIAAGQLEYRVKTRGSGEVADMGRSFNTMADRIGAMFTGQKELMAGVSHELRSPLARMKLQLELLRRDSRHGSGDPQSRIEGLEKEIDNLDELVEELLLASRFELGSVHLDLQPQQLSDLAAEAWQRIELAAADQGMSLQLELAKDATEVLVDRALVVRSLGNLFENALRHAGRGEVTLRSERRAERLWLSVADQGSGVEEEHLEHLFEPFYRADPSRSRQTGAGGLGLMIVRRAVAAHGGEVSARRAAGGGLEVIFDLPLASADPSASVPEGRPAARGVSGDATIDVRPTLDGKLHRGQSMVVSSM